MTVNAQWRPSSSSLSVATRATSTVERRDMASSPSTTTAPVQMVPWHWSGSALTSPRTDRPSSRLQSYRDNDGTVIRLRRPSQQLFRSAVTVWFSTNCELCVAVNSSICPPPWIPPVYPVVILNYNNASVRQTNKTKTNKRRGLNPCGHRRNSGFHFVGSAFCFHDTLTNPSRHPIPCRIVHAANYAIPFN